MLTETIIAQEGHPVGIAVRWRPIEIYLEDPGDAGGVDQLVLQGNRTQCVNIEYLQAIHDLRDMCKS
jgi:hypothetical protein